MQRQFHARQRRDAHGGRQRRDHGQPDTAAQCDGSDHRRRHADRAHGRRRPVGDLPCAVARCGHPTDQEGHAPQAGDGKELEERQRAIQRVGSRAPAAIGQHGKEILGRRPRGRKDERCRPAGEPWRQPAIRHIRDGQAERVEQDDHGEQGAGHGNHSAELDREGGRLQYEGGEQTQPRLGGADKSEQQQRGKERGHRNAVDAVGERQQERGGEEQDDALRGAIHGALRWPGRRGASAPLTALSMTCRTTASCECQRKVGR